LVSEAKDVAADALAHDSEADADLGAGSDRP
jgi:hypothetical protein